ncbi:MAG: FKBP-type peptidyl-prolyl cis-trans isomerase [Planctomycetota bacterium]
MTRPGSLVSLQLEIVDVDGDVVESTPPEEPLQVELGAGELPPSVEEALLGVDVGAEIDVVCPAGEAFGEHSPEAIVAVPRDEFPDDVELEKGASVGITVESDGGEVEEIDAVVVEVNPDAAILDANHPLAGREARFRVKVVAVEE